MFVEDGGGAWRPTPWQPPPKKPRMTKRQERVLVWLLAFNGFMLLAAPIGGASIVQALVAFFARH